MYESTTEPGRKFGSAFRGKRFDSYHAGEQPAGNNENETAEPQEAVASTADVVKAHGRATDVHIDHDHEGNKHTVTSTHEDGHEHKADYDSAKLAHEAGGELSAEDVKKHEHPDQQGAESEERNYEMPDLA